MPFPPLASWLTMGLSMGTFSVLACGFFILRGDIRVLKVQMEHINSNLKDLHQKTEGLYQRTEDLRQEAKDFRQETNARFDRQDTKLDQLIQALVPGKIHSVR